MEYGNIGVVGAGVMGIGVAQTLAQHGMRVRLVDKDQGSLGKAREKILEGLRMQNFFRTGKTGEPADAVLARIQFQIGYAGFAEVDYVVENVTEDFKIKRGIYHDLDVVCHRDCVFAANTSCLSITRIGAATQRPDRVIGVHFMNPVPLKPVVEAIRGYHTSEATIAGTRAFLAKIGKECILVNDYPGFVSNRILMLTVNEAVFTVQDGVASPEDVDGIFRRCFGHKMGPLETADLIGLDTILQSLEVLAESYGDPKFRPSPLLKKMVDAGLHGVKSGKGFFEYRIGA